MGRKVAPRLDYSAEISTLSKIRVLIEADTLRPRRWQERARLHLDALMASLTERPRRYRRSKIATT